MALLKPIGELLGLVCALPHLLGYALSRAIAGEERAFTAASEMIARLPGLLGIYTRRAFYRRTLAGVGRDASIGFMTLFSKTRAQVGDRAYIGRFCIIGWAEIGPDAMLADHVQVLSGRHQHGRGAGTPAGDPAGAKPLRENPREFVKVTIGAGAWVGAGAIVMADVGPGAIVAAGAVVIEPVAAGAKVGGVPAKVL